MVNPSHGLGEHDVDFDRLDLVTLHFLDFVGHGVGDDDDVDRRVFQPHRGVGRQKAVRRHHVDFVGASFLRVLG